MGKITDVVPQKKDAKRVNIFIDNQFAFGLSLELRFERKLEIGKSLAKNGSIIKLQWEKLPIFFRKKKIQKE